jgi:hypothetical protein
MNTRSEALVGCSGHCLPELCLENFCMDRKPFLMTGVDLWRPRLIGSLQFVWRSMDSIRAEMEMVPLMHHKVSPLRRYTGNGLEDSRLLHWWYNFVQASPRNRGGRALQNHCPQLGRFGQGALADPKLLDPHWERIHRCRGGL